MKKGFTLVELLIVTGIIVVIGAVVLINFANRRVDTDLVATTQQIGSLLRQAQSDAMAQEGGTSWGVHFANSSTRPTYTLFSGTSYATGTVVTQYVLPSTVAYTTSTLASGSSVDVVFSQINGVASASTTIGFYMPQENVAYSSTISIASSGAVSY